MVVITRRTSIVLGLFLLASCANTQKVWDKHDPNEYLQVKGPTSIEEEIESKGVDYFCQDIFYSSEGHEKICYVERNSAEKVKEWKFRLAKTPFAVVIDLTTIVVVVGFVALYVLLPRSGGWNL